MISEMNDKFWMPYPLGRANTSFAPVYIVSCYTFPLFLSYNTLFLISLLYLSSKEKIIFFILSVYNLAILLYICIRQQADGNL